ncbi:hypothetical protein MCI89_14445 [Muricomes sp. OA1]|uniref:hypothetical protein n=1 Tax=Muricomes sp. OA1 TaxID=2914165 RepID=UPI001F052EC8|nr:hypothetical protein [Muricomes sp. OA1]MCH1973543.1 hypothetical protein [Muricomes sp. OA1]
MKRKIIIMITSVILIILFWYLQYGRDVKICNSMILNSEDGYIQNISIVANRISISDKEDFAKEMIQRCIKNTFNEFQFSYDLNGYPEEINMSVYINEIAWKQNEKILEIEYNRDLGYVYIRNVCKIQN